MSTKKFKIFKAFQAVNFTTVQKKSLNVLNLSVKYDMLKITFQGTTKLQRMLENACIF